ncbi:kinase-like domain-containing protein [Cercophora scortea]|uniref:Kinase-like domain-containing protein n=1 Tax=Cercophora scortea TaxID=314031 RepID=A0AAE0MH82_9PEZI|nr:kinase-like domain-containing protein [Cercophora scortea]
MSGPIVVRLPRQVSKSRFLSMGAISWVYRITENIVVKYPRDIDAGEIERENAIYDIFEQHTPCPYVMQSFYRTANANFLPFMLPSLDTRLQRNQRREKFKVLQVLRIEDRHLVERWAAELCAAVAWIDSLGLVHGDLRPPNILFDERDHLKLTDFDCVARIGEPSYGNAPPWARLYPDPLTGGGYWGLYDPKTEQFAIGSLLYCMTRGHEPYGHPEEDDPELDVVGLFKKGVFPRLNAEGDVLDCIIDRCWAGWYDSMKDLAEAAAQLSGAVDMGAATTFSAEYCSQKRDECLRLIQNGLLEMDGRGDPKKQEAGLSKSQDGRGVTPKAGTV